MQYDDLISLSITFAVMVNIILHLQRIMHHEPFCGVQVCEIKISQLLQYLFILFCRWDRCEYIHYIVFCTKYVDKPHRPTFLLTFGTGSAWTVFSFLLPTAMPCKRCPCVLWTRNYCPGKEISSWFVAGPICVKSHPWKDTLGTYEDIWRYSTCHIC